MRKSTASVKLVLVALFLSGCVGSPVPTEPSSPPENDWGVEVKRGPNEELLLVELIPAEGVTQQALFEGSLRMDDSNCVVGVEVQTGNEFLLIFPNGTNISQSSVALPDGSQIELGNSVSFSGGYISTDELPDIPTECGQSEAFYIRG